MNTVLPKSFALAVTFVFTIGFLFVVTYSLISYIEFSKSISSDVMYGVALEEEYGFFLEIYLQDGVDIARFSVVPDSKMESYGVKTGDQLLGGSINDFYERFAATEGEFSFFVLRDGEPIEIIIPIENETSGS